MSISVNSVKCPECGATLSIEEGRTQVFCSYCGTKVLITNENEQIIRHIDEAGIKQAETERLIELKRLELEEKKREADEKTMKLKVKVSLALVALGVIMILIGAVSSSSGDDSESLMGLLTLFGMFPLLGAGFIWIIPNDKEDDNANDGKIRVPSDIFEYENKSYTAIEAKFRSAGFTNIRCVPLYDLTLGLVKKPNTVESITVNGKDVASVGKRCDPNSMIVISYHSMSGR